MDQISELLTRRVDQILPNKTGLETLLRSGKKIRLYQGFDPTGIKLHLGHSIGMRNLQKFAELGHEVIVLFGTGTVLVGDPSERDTGRKLITQEEIEANIKTWKLQVSKIIDLERVQIRFNGDWLIPLTLKDIIHIASNISAIQLFKRESFTRRLKAGDTIWYHETMYPLLQGYDSVAMDVDLEIGGTDQTFNMLIGRELQKKINNREKFVLTNPMILGTDGGQMSKTTGNCIWLDDLPEDMYGKTMSIPDSQISIYMQQLTNIPLQEIKNLRDNPLENKKRLALDITTQFYGSNMALKAQQTFEATVQNKEIPTDIKIFIPTIKNGTSFLTLLKDSGLGDSSGHLKRMIEQGAVNNKITDPNQVITFRSGDIIKFGKRKYRKIA